MCVVSFVGDHYHKQFEPYINIPNTNPIGQWQWTFNQITREEFDALKAKVEEMIDLLKKAKEIDEKTDQPDCENEKKMEMLKSVAKEFGYDLDFVGGNNAKATATTGTTNSGDRQRRK